MKGRRVLIIMGRAPWPMDDGWKMRSGNILKGLAAKGAIVDLVTFGKEGQAMDPDFESALARWEIVPRSKAFAPTDLLRGLLGRTPFSVLNYREPSFQVSVNRLCSENKHDLVLVEDVIMAQYVPTTFSGRQFLDMHNVESHLLARYANTESRLLRKVYAILTAKKLARYEVGVSGLFDGIFVCSSVDGDRLVSAGIQTPVHVAPNGIDPHFFQQVPNVGPDGSIVFVGSMDYHANISGILFFAKEILPRILALRPNARTYVVGKNPTKEVLDLASENLVVTGSVPDVRPYLAKAGAVVVPLVVGGGTRLKILEAMAMGKAMVSTGLGCEGIAVTSGENIEIADDPGAFAEKVVGLLADPERALTMGETAREYVLKTYTWELIVDRMAQSMTSS